MRTTLISIVILLAAAAFLLWSFLRTPSNLLVMPTAVVPTVAVPTATTETMVERVESCSAEIAIPGGYLVEGVVGAPAFPNPILSDSNPVDRMLADLLFDGLVRIDARGLAQPALATGWTVSEDGPYAAFYAAGRCDVA